MLLSAVSALELIGFLLLYTVFSALEIDIEKGQPVILVPIILRLLDQ
jgi:hypothetical protein